jgi:dTDP-4-dehydrorhamnose reductase
MHIPRMLVTGVSGLLGATFALIARECFAVTGLYRRHPVRVPGCRIQSVDLASEYETSECLDALRPSIIVHFAAATDVDVCEADPLMATKQNVETTRRLARWACANDCRFLLMSTDSVFDGQRGHYSEDDVPTPVNRYAATKLESETLVRGLVTEHLIIRAAIYGWNVQDKCSLAEWGLSRLEAREVIPGFTDVFFSPLLVNTLSDLMLTLITRAARGTYHLGSLDPVSKYCFFLAIAEIFGLPRNRVRGILLKDMGDRAPRPSNTSLSSAKAQRDFGISLPTVRQDLQRFRQLREENYPAFLKTLLIEGPHQ